MDHPRNPALFLRHLLLVVATLLTAIPVTSAAVAARTKQPASSAVESSRVRTVRHARPASSARSRRPVFLIPHEDVAELEDALDVFG